MDKSIKQEQDPLQRRKHIDYKKKSKRKKSPLERFSKDKCNKDLFVQKILRDNNQNKSFKF